MAFMLSDDGSDYKGKLIYAQYFNKNDCNIYCPSQYDTNSWHRLYVLPYKTEVQRLNYIDVLKPEEITQAITKYNQNIYDIIIIRQFHNSDFVKNYNQTDYINQKLKGWQINDLNQILTYESKLKTIHSNFDNNSSIKIYHNQAQSGKSFVLMELSSYHIKFTSKTPDVNFIKSTIVVTPHKTLFEWKDKLELFYTKPFHIIDSTKSFNDFNKSEYQMIILSDKFYNDFIIHIKANKILINRLVFDSFLNLTNITKKPDNVLVTYIVSNNIKNIIVPFSNSFLGTKTIKNKIFNQIFESIYAKFDYYISQKTRLFINNIILNACELGHTTNLPQYVQNILLNFSSYFDETEFNNINDNEKLKYLIDNKYKYTKLINKYIEQLNSNFLGNSEVDLSIFKSIICHSIKPNSNEISDNQVFKNLIDNEQFIDIINIFNIQPTTISEIVDKFGYNKSVESQYALKERISTKECLVCYDKPDIEVVTDCCQNLFCMSCYMKSVQTSLKCPMCRCDIDISKNMIIKDSFKDINKLSSLENTIDLVKQYSEFYDRVTNFDKVISYITKNNPEPKMLILFTDYTYNSFAESRSANKSKYQKSKEYVNIMNVLDKYGLTSFELLGNSNKIELNYKHLNSLNSDLINAFIFNNKTTYNSIGDFGLSFHNIDYVIYYNDFNHDRISFFKCKNFKCFKTQPQQHFSFLKSTTSDKPVELFYIQN